VTLADPRVEQPSVRRYYLVPSATTAAEGKSAALDVLAQALGSGSQFAALSRARHGQASSRCRAGAWYQGTALDRDAVRASRPIRRPGSNSRRSRR
jgi:zinc protease